MVRSRKKKKKNPKAMIKFSLLVYSQGVCATTFANGPGEAHDSFASPSAPLDQGTQQSRN
jgi:hypothetical protein